MGNKNTKRAPSKALPSILSDINRDIKALNSSILIISQKMKYLARNEKILGRNLIVLNKKIADLRTQVQTGVGVATGSTPMTVSAELPPELAENVARMQAQVNLMQGSLKELSQQIKDCVTADEIAELKYLVETIDPLEFVTVKQVQKVLGKKLPARKLKKKAVKKPKKKAKPKKKSKKKSKKKTKKKR
jgi:hypothetical protein